MRHSSGEKEQQKKLYMIVGGIMCVVALLWGILLYPNALQQVAQTSDSETERFLGGIDSARQELDGQLEQRKKDQEAELNSLPHEEEKEEIDIPRLPTSEEVENVNEKEKESE